MPTFLANGLPGEQIPLLRAPNFRPEGRALLIVELKNANLGTFPQALSGIAAGRATRYD